MVSGPATRYFGVLYGTFAVALGYGMLVPLVPAYLRSGTSGADVALHTGALAAAFMLAASAAAPFWGHLSDRIGRKAVIVAGLLGASAAPIPFALSHGLIELYAFQGLAGAFFGAVASAAAALMFEEGAVLGAGRRLGLLGAATLAGYLAGPVLGGWLAGTAETARAALEPHDVVLAALSAHAGLVLVAVPLTWLQVKPHRAPGGADRRARDPRSMRAALLALSAAIVAAFALGGFEIATSLHVRGPLGLGSRAVAAVFVACGLGMLIAQLAFLPRLAAGSRPLAWSLGLLIGVAGLLAGIPLARAYRLVLADSALIGAGLGLGIALLGLQTAALTGERRGLALGLQSSVVNAGQAAGSAAAGAAFRELGHNVFTFLALALALCAVALGLVHRRYSFPAADA